MFGEILYDTETSQEKTGMLLVWLASQSLASGSPTTDVIPSNKYVFWLEVNNGSCGNPREKSKLSPKAKFSLCSL